jgi:pimeloyl-ACP methyl ester carboxylesterase
MGIPPFEFSRITADLDVSRLYVRDFDRCFYHRGLRGHSSDIDTTASQLAKYVALADAERVVCIGQSMGAYAALLFGALINADEVHAFVPRTLIAFEAGQLINLPAMRKHLRKLERYPHVQDKYFDLLDLFRSTGFVSPSHIYHGLEHPNDKWHATRMASAPNVTVHVVNHNRHSITAALRDSGELTRILQAAIRGEVVGNGG